MSATRRSRSLGNEGHDVPVGRPPLGGRVLMGSGEAR